MVNSSFVLQSYVEVKIDSKRALQNLHLAQSQISDIRLITEKRFGDPVSEYGMTFDRVLQSSIEITF
jgi:hypothetical protein